MFFCDKCQYKVSSKAILKIHEDYFHQDKKNQVLKKDNLDQHRKEVHEGVKYPCGQCSYEATSKGGVALHKRAVHEGVKYSCGECGHQFTSKGNLARHKRN